MFFSEKFNVGSELIETYGAVDISLICDVPLFVDPMLILIVINQNINHCMRKLLNSFTSYIKKLRRGSQRKRLELGLILKKCLIIGWDIH